MQEQTIRKPIVFDMYDTLIDESTIYKKFLSRMAEKYSLKKSPEELLISMFQLQREIVFINPKIPYKEITKIAYKKLIEEADPDDVNDLFELFPEMDFFPNVISILKGLEKNHDLFILTNTDNDLLEKTNLRLKSPVTFKKIFTAEDNGAYKPHKKAYQSVVDFFNMQPKEIVFVSSNKWDFNASKEFGFNTKTIEELKTLI